VSGQLYQKNFTLGPSIVRYFVENRILERAGQTDGTFTAYARMWIVEIRRIFSARSHTSLAIESVERERAGRTSPHAHSAGAGVSLVKTSFIAIYFVSFYGHTGHHGKISAAGPSVPYQHIVYPKRTMPGNPGNVTLGPPAVNFLFADTMNASRRRRV
jgi:hypothetical protein